MVRMFHLAAIALAAGLLSCTALSSAGAAPTTVTVDEFAVDRDGAPLFDDTFATTTPMVGGTGTLVQSSASFTSGTPTTANYFVRGTILRNNPTATLNTATGVTVSQPPPFLSSIQLTNAFLQTGTGAGGARTLTPTSSFDVVGLFDVSVPTTPLGTYDIVLTNRTQANGDQGNLLESRLRECVAHEGLCGALSGPVLQFYWADFINHTEALIGQQALTPAELLEPQMLLEFAKGANSDAITANAFFGTGTTLGTFSGIGFSLGSTGAGTDVFTPANQFVLAGFEAFQPTQTAVPEPSSLLLLSGGLLGLGVVLRTRRA